MAKGAKKREGGREQRMNSTQPILKGEEEGDGKRREDKNRGEGAEYHQRREGRQVWTVSSLSARVIFLFRLFSISKITSLYLTPYSFLQVKLCPPPSSTFHSPPPSILHSVHVYANEVIRKPSSFKV